MTKKGIIILTSTLMAVLTLIVILFGVVFCLRTIDVKVTDDIPLEISNEAIEETSGLKKGSSIFMLDKDAAISNLESSYPELKVVQIKTVSVMRVEICVRTRQKMFYASYNDKYYVLDEELKVLDVLEIKPTDLIYIDTETEGYKKLGITGNTKEGNFVSTSEFRLSTYNIYTSMHNRVIVNSHYAERDDMKELIDEIAYTDRCTSAGNKYLTIIIKTSTGATIEIVEPTKDCETKIGVCFNKYFDLEDKTTGIIRANADGTFVTI